MAFPTTMNDGITDSITESSLAVIGAVPAVATANLMIATSDALALAAHNASDAQRQGNQLAQTVTTLGIDLLRKLMPKG